MKGHCARHSRGGVRLGPAVFAALLVLPSVASARPIVAIISPSNNAPLSGEIWVTAAFRSDTKRPISRLELQCDGRSVQELVLPTPVPEGQKSFPINLSALPPGAHELSVVAADTAGESGSAAVTVSVSGGPGGATGPAGYGSGPAADPAGAAAEYDQIPPVVSIYYPAQGATVARTVPIRVEAKDNVAVRHVLFYVDGKLHTVRMTDPPFAANWDTTRATDGPHILEARAKDTQGNEGQAAPVTIIVRNAAPGPEPLVNPDAEGSVVPGPVAPGPSEGPSGPAVVIPGPTRPPVGPTAPEPGGGEPAASRGPGAVGPRVIVPPVPTPPTPGEGSGGGVSDAVPGPAPVRTSHRPPPEAAPQPAETADAETPTASAPPALGAAGQPKLPTRPGPQVTVPGTKLGTAGLARPDKTSEQGTTAPTGHATLKRADETDAGDPTTPADPKASDGGQESVEPAASVQPGETEAAPAPAAPAGEPSTTAPAEVAAPAAGAAPEPEAVRDTAAGPDTPPAEPVATGPEPTAGPTTSVPETLPPAGPETAAGAIGTAAGVVTVPGARLKPEGTQPAATPVPAPADAGDAGAASGAPVGEASVAGEPAHATGAETAETPTGPEPAAALEPAQDAPSPAAPETVAAPAQAPDVEPAAPGALTPTGAGAYHEGPKAAAPGVGLDPNEGRPEPAPTATPAAAPAAATRQPSRAVEAPDDAAPVGASAKTPRAGLRRLGAGSSAAAPSALVAPAEPTGEVSTAQASPHPLTVADAPSIKTAKVFVGERALPDEARPELVDDALMISLKPVFEAFDGALYWFPGDRVARGVTADADLAIQIGSTQATLNGRSCEVKPAPVLKNGRILAPIGLVGQALSVGFEFDPATGAVRIAR